MCTIQILDIMSKITQCFILDCLDGRYGDNCAGICGYCKDGTTCRKDNGHCSVCAPGYLGDWCTTGNILALDNTYKC